MENNLNLTPELLEKANSAPSAEALLTLAQENGTTLTAEQAVTYYTQLHPEVGALSDEELDNVSGGGLCGKPPKPEKCGRCGRTEFVYINMSVGTDLSCRWVWACKHCDLSN